VRPSRLIAAALVAATLLAYAPVVRNEFVQYDDHVFIGENEHVRAGLTAASIRWAFTSIELSNWFPLTRLSHLLDVQLFGMRPGWHHLVSLLIHAANAALLFTVLRGMTGALWRSALVAGLFALHPLHVESVAWASERKDVLCALFWMLALAAYLRYARRPSAAGYGAVLAAVACSLMAKPLAVTLPAALLLLDAWPLRRWGPGGTAPARLLLEKLPLFALSAASSAITFHAQDASGAIADYGIYTAAMRARGVLLAYAQYLGKTFWPRDLSVLYFFHSQHAASWQIAAAGAALLLVTAALLLLFRRRPHLAVGWLWFLGVLVPMLGIVQVGLQSFADRYTYLPHVGLFVALSWGTGDLVGLRPRLRAGAAAIWTAALAALLALTFAQALVWRSTVTLFTRALEISPDNLVAEMILGQALTRAGRIPDANRHFLRILDRFPGQRDAHLLLGVNYYHAGNLPAAKTHFEYELQNNPRSEAAHLYLAFILESGGRDREARDHYEAAVRINPTGFAQHRGLGLLLLRSGDWTGALQHLQLARAINPADPEMPRRIEEAARRQRSGAR
jgi:tetratricopeptide (TPR) repeat protein